MYNIFLLFTGFSKKKCTRVAWKTRNTFQSPNVLQSRRQGPKMCKNKGTNLSRNLTRNRILSLGLENHRTLEWISDRFPGTLTYMLFLENCCNSAPMCSFSPIQGTMSWLVLKFHVTRIWELDICFPFILWKNRLIRVLNLFTFAQTQISWIVEISYFILILILLEAAGTIAYPI